ncbi:MAG: DUF4276 family protein [Nitrososphaerales archaeon]
MKFLEVLVEGTSDQPTVRVILKNRFGLIENQDFRIHPHQGKGKIPKHPHHKPNPKHRGLLDLLPATLKGYASFPVDRCVVVLVDADDTPCVTLKAELAELHRKLKYRPSCALFRIAVEETESWFIADPDAIRQAYPRAKTSLLDGTKPDSVIGAWELLARALGRKPEDCSSADKHEWATKIAPYLDLDDPKSPSLRAFVKGINKLLGGPTK